MKMNKNTLMRILREYGCGKKIIEAAAKLPDRGLFGIQDILCQLCQLKEV